VGLIRPAGDSPAPEPLLPDDLLTTLAQRAETLAAGHTRRVLIGIAGAPGAGKSTLAAALAARLAGGDWRGSPVAHLPMDGFHLAVPELERQGILDRLGAPETFDVDGYRSLLERVRAGEAVYAPQFERTLEQPVAGALPVVAATRIVFSEGNYLLLSSAPWQAVRAVFDEVWFCTVEHGLRRRRLLARHVQHGKSAPDAAAWRRRTRPITFRTRKVRNASTRRWRSFNAPGPKRIFLIAANTFNLRT